MIKKAGYHFYQLKGKIDARRQMIQVEGRLGYWVGEESKTLVFYLHRGLEMQSLCCQGFKEYEFDREASTSPFTPEAGKLTVVLDGPVQKGDWLELEFKYTGQLGVVTRWSVNRITPEWVELGLYTPWFPVTPSFERFTYEVKLHMAAEYNVAGTGVVEDEGDYWLLTGEEPDRDCVIVASKELRNVEMAKNGIEVSVHYTNPAEDKLAEDLLTSGIWILQKYTELFGPVNGNRATMVIAPRTEGGGYARRGFIVLTPMEKGTDLASYFKYTAHELGHLWWWKAPTDTWEDWLNESLAEYAALMAIRERFGEDAFAKVMISKESTITNVPAMYGLKRKNEQAEKVFCGKGVVILHQLEKEMGRDSFLALLREMVRCETPTTGGFVKLVSERAGEGVAQRFEEQLRQ